MKTKIYAVFLSFVAVFAVIAILITANMLTSEDSVSAQTTTPNPADTSSAPNENTTAEDTTVANDTNDDETTAEAKTDFNYSLIKDNITIDAKNAFVYDCASNTVIYQKGENERIYPASITKLLTALVALKYAENDYVITPTDELELVAEDSSVAYIKSNHSLTVEMLVEGMLLPSGNDAAYVLAAGVGRIIANDSGLSGRAAVDAFVEEMNNYAKTLGMTSSHFTCPDGYHDDLHYTTVNDMILLAKYSCENEVIMKYANIESDNVKYASGHTMRWSNSNLLISKQSQYYYDKAIGLKTGTTDEAGCCIIGAATDNGRIMLAGVFGAPDTGERFAICKTLLQLGFKNAK